MPHIGRRRVARGVCALDARSEEHTSELQSRQYLVCRLLLEKKTPTPPTRPNDFYDLLRCGILSCLDNLDHTAPLEHLLVNHTAAPLLLRNRSRFDTHVTNVS